MIIDHRDYYNHGAIEAIDAIESACSGLQGYEGFLVGTALADLKKARYYLDRLITEQEKALGIEHAETMPEHFGQDMSAMAEDTK